MLPRWLTTHCVFCFNLLNFWGIYLWDFCLSRRKWCENWVCETVNIKKIYIIWETLSSVVVWVTLDKMQFQLKVNWFLHRNSLLKLPLMKVSAETFAVVTVSHYKRLKKSKALGRFADWESTIHTAHMHTVLYMFPYINTLFNEQVTSSFLHVHCKSIW